MVQGEFLGGMGELADRFEGFVLDQWGVLHNGSTPYPGAVELVNELRRRGKRMVLLSNSGRRAAHNAQQLEAIGFNPAAFDGIVTSGEVCWQALAAKGHGLLGDLGRRCLLIARSGDTTPVDGLDLDLVEEPELADFIFLSWLEHSPTKLALLQQVLERGPGRELVMICANPDRVAPVEGGLIEAPGAVASRYEEAGGNVVYIGKPHKPIYEALLGHFKEFEIDKLVCVGDSLEHDIKGANDMGLKSCLVAGGIHENEIGTHLADNERTDTLRKICNLHQAEPDFVVPAFSWS